MSDKCKVVVKGLTNMVYPCDKLLSRCHHKLYVDSDYDVDIEFGDEQLYAKYCPFCGLNYKEALCSVQE